jgi:predicted nucleotidyltransferase
MNDLQEYSDLINEEANQFYERRIISYERIQFILGLWNIPIKLFGSCASGITIKNSDIDVAVDNSILNYFLTLPETQRHKAAL